MHKQIGSVLLILGTCIGAAMLALPVVTSSNSFSLTVILMVVAWAVMTVGAWTLLRVNLWCAPGSNLISMSKQTLGIGAQVLTWIIYLLLLYSLICAYLAGSADLVHGLFSMLKLNVAFYQSAVIAALFLGLIVYAGISSVDMLNRGLMSLKLIVLAIVIILLLPHANFSRLEHGDFTFHGSGFMVMITSFGFGIILPSLRVYLNNNRESLKRVLWIGSLLPLVIYLIWIAVIQGVVPKSGDAGLSAMVSSSNTNTMLLSAISHALSGETASVFGGIFVSICALTSFLGVSVCLMDFLSDGLNMKRQGWSGLVIFLLTYVPPLIIVLLAPQIFTIALTYAGIFSVYVLILLPLAMLWGGKRKNMQRYSA